MSTNSIQPIKLAIYITVSEVNFFLWKKLFHGKDLELDHLYGETLDR